MDKIKLILLIDDDEINNFLNKRLFLKLGIAEEVAVVLNGAEGLKFIKEHCGNGNSCPELIIIDINMPVMDGFQFLKHFQDMPLERKGDIVLVMLTTSSSPLDLELVSKYQVSGYVTKPLTEEKINYIKNLL
ncbi:MAG TPA: response regulator [Cytophagales bacterium]|nr:response regulator [Cytophagales bacterium]